MVLLVIIVKKNLHSNSTVTSFVYDHIKRAKKFEKEKRFEQCKLNLSSGPFSVSYLKELKLTVTKTLTF